MFCPNCGSPNQPNTEKCVACGKPLPRLSPTGEPIPVTAETPSDRPAGWPATPAQPANPGTNFLPGQPGSQYSFQPPAYGQPNPTGQPGPYNYGQPSYGGYVPVPSYSIPADRVGVASGEAGFWPRFGAYMIDSTILSIFIGIVFIVPFIIWLVNFASRYGNELANVCDSTANSYNNAACNRQITQILQSNNELGSFITLLFVTILLSIVVYVLYYTVLAPRGNTLGKRVFGLRVIGPNGQPPGFGRCLLRYTLGYFVSGSIFWLGFIWIAFDPQHQGWHDKIASTYVVQANSQPPA